MITLTIPAATPSVNRLHGFHWSLKARERKKWGWLVRIARMGLPAPLYAPEHVSLTIERYGPRLLDYDNYVAGTKFLTDQLVAEGFAVDDSPAHMTVRYVQHVGKPPRTVVRIGT
jgi:hypothetical protein